MKMTRKMQFELVDTFAQISAGSLEWEQLACHLAITANKFPIDSAWRTNLLKLSAFVDQLISDTDLKEYLQFKTPFSIFAKKGNSKLPFVAFSALPGAGDAKGSGLCPGAGDCAEFCYSLRAWRYPAAFCRMFQNSILLRHSAGRFFIRRAFDRIKLNATLRLYVDGDFFDVSEVIFWMGMADRRADLKLYGYSKSFAQLLAFAEQGRAWPSNYTLNISSGHNHSSDIVERVKALPITRGEFIAIGKKGRLQYGTKAYGSTARKEAEKAGLGNVFVCPGECGSCTKKAHACGDKTRFSDIPIVILAH